MTLFSSFLCPVWDKRTGMMLHFLHAKLVSHQQLHVLSVSAGQIPRSQDSDSESMATNEYL